MIVRREGGAMEPKRSIRVPRKLWLAVALVVLGGLLLAQNSTVLVPDLDSYVVVNQRTIAVRVAVAPCSWTQVTNIAETPTEVRIKVGLGRGLSTPRAVLFKSHPELRQECDA